MNSDQHSTRGSKTVKGALLCLSLLFCQTSPGTQLRPRELNLPMTCAELLPDPEPFQNFFEAVARGAVSSFPRLSKKMFQVLAMRQKIAEMSAHVRDENPVEVLVRRTLCFFRESKEPLRVILFDDSDFLKFMNESIDELQKRVEQAVLDEAIDRYQRQSYDKRLERNSRFIEQLQREADASANKIFEALSRQAKRRVDNP